ncbi:MAG: hypothetical protein JXR83_04295 [Deltaproteobacteria bacterium]|nr:hypothetical protein [Deltaproteobacteria bacterium]
MPPGGEAEVDVKVLTAGRSGKLLKTVSVFSNDPKKPIAQLHVACLIEVPDGGATGRPQMAQLPPRAAGSRPFAIPASQIGRRRAPPAQPGRPGR